MSPKRRAIIKICAAPSCHKEISQDELAASYATEEKIFYFHPRCFDELCSSDGKMNDYLISQALKDFAKKGLEPEIDLSEGHSGLKEQIPGFEPSKENKLNYLEMIEAFLAHYNQPLSRKTIAYETGIPYTTVTWRVWDHLESNPKASDKRFYIHKERGPRGIELVGLIK